MFPDPSHIYSFAAKMFRKKNALPSSDKRGIASTARLEFSASNSLARAADVRTAQPLAPIS